MSMQQNPNPLLQRIVEQEKEAKKFGFYWESEQQLIEQIQSECEEIREASSKGDQKNLQEEIGDLMSAAVSLCIFFGFDPEATLAESIEKFQLRYDTLVRLVKEQGLDSLVGKSMPELLEFWHRAKTANK